MEIDLERIINERIATLKRTVPTYRRVVEQWQMQLTEVEDWYRKRRKEFSRTTDSIIAQYKARQSQDSSHDHTYACKSKYKYVPHDCHPGCWREPALPTWYKYGPLTLPLLLGWQRPIMRHSNPAGARQGRDSRHVHYIAPCGRRLRSMDEVYLFLEHTEVTTLNVTNFTFDPYCVAQSHHYDPRLTRAKVFIPDVSNGKERRPVSCLNSLSSESPEPFTYITKRTHEPSIQLHTERGFLVSCSCKDNCQNRSKCECWQLTLQESEALGGSRHSVGYVHRRLKREQHSAIYECNVYCSCGPHCGNRVVQNGLQNRLQVFKTEKMGWGLRTLDDIPKGTYICTYLGHIYTEQGGDEKAVHYGDEYFAELDYIEVMEHHKEGYESDVDDAMSECSVASRASSDQGSTYSVMSAGDMKVRLKKSSRKSTVSISPIVISSDEDEDEDDNLMIIGDSPPFTPATTPTPSLAIPPVLNLSSTGLGDEQPATPPTLPQPSATAHLSPIRLQGMRTRRLFTEDFSYIMDAKNTGNLGRYVNHSCNPNTFVQNIFIDTHDLRFPWVALFAKKRIKALQELTWDYNYEVGSVEGKVIQCLCGAPNCRGRLL